MKTENLILQGEELQKELKSIRLTHDLICEINLIQTGGCTSFEKFEDSLFDNSTVDFNIKKLEPLTDFIMDLYLRGDELDPKVALEYLSIIHELKNHFNAFRV